MSILGNLLIRVGTSFGGAPAASPEPEIEAQPPLLPGESSPGTSEIGQRPTPENATKYLYRTMWVDPDVRSRILDIRSMDANDGRVKKIHARTARAAVKGGLRLNNPGRNEHLDRAWQRFARRLKLDRFEKLESDMRGLMMEGNLPMQWVLGPDKRVATGVRMPSETILPEVEANGLFKNPKNAYTQYDLTTGQPLARFALWQLSLVRLTPDNYDDLGSMGRPYLDATRSVWKKLRMTEEDLVIRRRERAPLRTAHVLEGAGPEDLEAYREKVEADQQSITTNYYLNKKGGVTAIQGDTNLDQIADVAHLLDTFFAGAPAPAGLFGYVGDINRDILEDLKKDYFDELDALQDTLAYVYRLGFELELLLSGINPDAEKFDIIFAERRTDTPNQRADLALKHQALGVPPRMVWGSAGLDPAEVAAQREAAKNDNDPYPGEDDDFNPPPGTPRVSITPGNSPKGESATSIGNGG